MKTKATHLKLSLSEKMCEKFILGRFLACLIRERERESFIVYKMFRDYHMTAGRKVRGPRFGFSLYKSNIKKMYISR
jgi:hypothetical protein